MQGKPLVVQSTQTNGIAAAVQAGNADILTLWAAVERYALKRANRWDKAFQGRYGITLDDLRQTAFIALTKAVELWDPERGGFIGAYELQLKSTFAELYRSMHPPRVPVKTGVPRCHSRTYSRTQRHKQHFSALSRMSLLQRYAVQLSRCRSRSVKL